MIFSEDELNGFYDGARQAGGTPQTIDGHVVMIVADNAITIETMVIDHVWYHRHRAGANDEWMEWAVRP